MIDIDEIIRKSKDNKWSVSIKDASKSYKDSDGSVADTEDFIQYFRKTIEDHDKIYGYIDGQGILEIPVKELDYHPGLPICGSETPYGWLEFWPEEYGVWWSFDMDALAYTHKLKRR